MGAKVQVWPGSYYQDLKRKKILSDPATGSECKSQSTKDNKQSNNDCIVITIGSG